jgi:hypothetical protein
MGSADDEGPKRPAPTYRVFRPSHAWDKQSDTIRAQPAPQQPSESKSQKDSLPPFESEEIKRLRQHEDQAARQQTTPTQAPPAQQEAKAPTPDPATPDPAAGQQPVGLLKRVQHGLERLFGTYDELHETEKQVEDNKVAAQAEHGAAKAAPIYKFDAATEKYIADRLKGFDAHFANDPAGRLDLAFEAYIKKDLDPKGPSFEHIDAGGFFEDSRREFYAQHPNALPRSQEPPAHVRESEDKKTAQQEAAKNSTQQPERKLTKEEFLQEERQNRAQRLKAAQREVTQHEKGAQQQHGQSRGGGISR